MLRPERMSRVSVAGSKPVLDDVIETVYDLFAVHLSEYNGSWEGFEPGDPLDGAEEASQRLVTVRSLLNTLEVDAENGGPTRIVDPTEANRELETVREQVNDLDDRREDLTEDRQAIDERLAAVETLAALGIDLDLLSGYESLSTRVGEGNPDAVRESLSNNEGIESYEVFTGDDDAVGIFARPAETADDTDPLEDALVGVEFTPIEVPDDEGSPEAYASDLRDRRSALESELETVEADLGDVREEKGPFLLAMEEHLAIAVQKREVPLSFATTENAFVAEGWIPTERFVDLAEALETAVGEHCELDEIERAAYTQSGRVGDPEPVEGGPGGSPDAITDGGTTTDDRRMDSNGPPVVQDNPDVVKPFETLVGAMGRPKYTEIDPSIVLFLTFPLFYGYMVGDVGYGLVYTILGYSVYRYFEGGLSQLGKVGLWMGGFTILFGVLYGEFFGLHIVADLIWHGHPPIEKGISPALSDLAAGWMVVSLVVGVLHVSLGYVFDFIDLYRLHGLREAIMESASWFMLMNGLWIWIFSTHAQAVKPGLLYTTFASGGPFDIGFAGFPALVGIAGLVAAVIGFLLVMRVEAHELGPVGYFVGFLEGLTNPLVNVLSYTRLAAVLLAKAGMAFVVNLLFFGAVTTPDGHLELAIGHAPSTIEGQPLFEGLVNFGVGGIIGGLVVLVLGHIVVLFLGVTSPGLQAIRLEYVEFFQKFYDGGGRDYRPFGRNRQYTAEE